MRVILLCLYFICLCGRSAFLRLWEEWEIGFLIFEKFEPLCSYWFKLLLCHNFYIYIYQWLKIICIQIIIIMALRMRGNVIFPLSIRWISKVYKGENDYCWNTLLLCFFFFSLNFFFLKEKRGGEKGAKNFVFHWFKLLLVLSYLFQCILCTVNFFLKVDCACVFSMVFGKKKLIELMDERDYFLSWWLD